MTFKISIYRCLYYDDGSLKYLDRLYNKYYSSISKNNSFDFSETLTIDLKEDTYFDDFLNTNIDVTYDTVLIVIEKNNTTFSQFDIADGIYTNEKNKVLGFLGFSGLKEPLTLPQDQWK